jgi:casein kinase II subunit beta
LFNYSSSSTSSEEDARYWVQWFLSNRGNEYFCDVSEEYITDRFNLTGLQTQVPLFSLALELITDQLSDDDIDSGQREDMEKSARHLYGLIHARFILTNEGLRKMATKFKKFHFGKCPRVLL